LIIIAFFSAYISFLGR